MTEAPLLAKPSPEDILYLYLAVSEQAVSAVLMKEEQKLEKPIYYVSKVLHGAELNYSTTEKFVFALITTSRKLRPYFQAHKIEVLTDQPLRNILHSPKLDFPTMNNEAEYEALIAALGLARAVRAKNLNVCGDSRLVLAQVKSEFEAKNETMARYLRVVKGILTRFDEWYAEHVSREENTTTDALSQFASSEIENYPRSIYFQILKTPTIHVIDLIALVGMASCWIDPIKTHLETGWLPDDAKEARKLSGPRSQDNSVGVLLANYASRCKGLCEEMRQMPKASSDSTTSPREAYVNQHTHPFCNVGDGHTWTISYGIGTEKFIVVAIDYFTKWIEAKALAKITTKQITQFFWENVICRYGIPRILVTDNGK
ncbi:uncharacterized protein LOC141690755 [Apium graveolens]|uniref:uncharacterized protein LOC141690755 n=1 Tax=Apium graveolens TaxID=4045 RepID=UPI003D7A76D6